MNGHIYSTTRTLLLRQYRTGEEGRLSRISILHRGLSYKSKWKQFTVQCGKFYHPSRLHPAQTNTILVTNEADEWAKCQLPDRVTALTLLGWQSACHGRMRLGGHGTPRKFFQGFLMLKALLIKFNHQVRLSKRWDCERACLSFKLRSRLMNGNWWPAPLRMRPPRMYFMARPRTSDFCFGGRLEYCSFMRCPRFASSCSLAVQFRSIPSHLAGELHFTSHRQAT